VSNTDDAGKTDVTVTEAASPAPGGAGPLAFVKSPFVIAFVVGAIALTILPVLQQLTLRAPPPVASLGTWELVDHRGQPFGSETLKGQVWIASVFFSRCPSICPPQQAAFSRILNHVDDLRSPNKPPIRLVSFTVDPEFDTPEVLAAYAQKNGWAGNPLWDFVSGSDGDLKNLLVKRMFLEVGEKMPLPGDAELFDISHANRFVLIDQNGDVRGYWTTDDLGRGNLINAARLLWKRGPNP
jgi:protein SCO1/2